MLNLGVTAARSIGVLLLTVGVPALVLGIALRKTGLFGLLFLIVGGYCVLQGVFIFLEIWWRGRRGSR
jgi:hypothetical protein